MSEFEEVRPDVFYPVNIGDGETYIVNAKYDRVDYFHRWGHYVLKLYDDEDGLITLHLSGEADALALNEHAELPIVPRDFMYQSEYDGYIAAQAASLEERFDEE